MANLNDFQPDFASRLGQLRAALDAAKIGYTLESGYRSPEYQGQMYANHQARVARQPLPYPNVEAPAVVAPAWRSFHNYGLATDFHLQNDADYARLASLAPQFGLTGIGPSDKGHIQMGGDLASDIAQYHLGGWRPASQPAPASGAIAYTGLSAQPSRHGTIASGTTLNSSPLDIVLHAESGDRNINNTHQMTSSGQAQGNAQITTGTWNDFAPKAGIDLRQYPTPHSAPPDVQIKVASVIPLNRWASSTVNAVLAKYPGIDTSQTLGAIQSAAINPSGAPTAVAGGPAAPAAPGQPATGPVGSAGNLPGFEANSPGAKMTAEGLKSLGLGAKPAEPPQMPSAPSIPTAQAMGGPMMMGPGQMNMQPRLNASIAAFTPGLPSRPLAQPGAATGMPTMMGTTLNSPSQLQMALMTGQMSPYDAYAAQYGGGSGSA